MLRMTLVTVLLALAACEAQSPKIGFVDLNQILENWKVVKNFEDQVNKRIADTQAEIEALTKDVEKLTADLVAAKEVYDGSSQAVRDIKEARRMKLAKLKSTRDFNLAYLQKQVNDKTVQFYNDAVKKIQEFASRANYDVILKASGQELEADDQGTLRLKIAYRTVLFHAESNDITDSVLEELNR